MIESVRTYSSSEPLGHQSSPSSSPRPLELPFDPFALIQESQSLINPSTAFLEDRVSFISSPTTAPPKVEPEQEECYRRIYHLLRPPVFQGLFQEPQVNEMFENAKKGAYCVYKDQQVGYCLVIASPEKKYNYKKISFQYNEQASQFGEITTSKGIIKSFKDLKKYYPIDLPLCKIPGLSNPLQHQIGKRKSRTASKPKKEVGIPRAYTTTAPEIFIQFFGITSYRTVPTTEALRKLFQDKEKGCYKIYYCNKREMIQHGKLVIAAPDEVKNPKTISFRFDETTLVVLPKEESRYHSFSELINKYALTKLLSDGIHPQKVAVPPSSASQQSPTLRHLTHNYHQYQALQKNEEELRTRFFKRGPLKASPKITVLHKIFEGAKKGDYQVYAVDRNNKEPLGKIVIASLNPENPFRTLFFWFENGLLRTRERLPDNTIDHNSWFSLDTLSRAYELLRWLPDQSNPPPSFSEISSQSHSPTFEYLVPGSPERPEPLSMDIPADITSTSLADSFPPLLNLYNPT